MKKFLLLGIAFLTISSCNQEDDKTTIDNPLTTTKSLNARKLSLDELEDNEIRFIFTDLYGSHVFPEMKPDVYLGLKGENIHIDWGHGNTTIVGSTNEEVITVGHNYQTSPENIPWVSIKGEVEELYFEAGYGTYTSPFEVTGHFIFKSEFLKKFDYKYSSFTGGMDFSGAPNLRELSITTSNNVTDAPRNPLNLEYFDLLNNKKLERFTLAAINSEYIPDIDFTSFPILKFIKVAYPCKKNNIGISYENYDENGISKEDKVSISCY